MFPEEPDYLTVENSQISFQKIFTKDFLAADRSLSLRNANVILLPLENYREEIPLCFHHGTRSLYLYFKQNHPEIALDLCVNSNDFKELSLHSDEFRLGAFILESILAPTFVTILSHYIINTLFAKKEDKVNVDLIVLKEKSNEEGVKIRYRGSPVEMELEINTQIELYTKNGKLVSSSNLGNHIDEKR